MNTESENRSAGLRERSLKAVVWSSADTFGRQGIQFVTSIILARLLSPKEFGLVGMVLVFMAIATAFVDSGFSSALIQRKELTEEDKTSVFLFNITAGLAMAAMMFWAAPAVARFYEQPILTGLTRLMALNLFISAWGSVQFALLSRQLNFKTQCKVSMVASAFQAPLPWRWRGGARACGAWPSRRTSRRSPPRCWSGPSCHGGRAGKRACIRCVPCSASDRAYSRRECSTRYLTAFNCC